MPIDAYSGVVCCLLFYYFVVDSIGLENKPKNNNNSFNSK